MEIWLNTQVKQINQLKTNINRLKEELQHQRQLQSQGFIPKKYHPKTHLQTDNDPFRQSFNKKFEKIFFEHLTSVITANTVSLEIKTTRLQQLIENTETRIKQSKESPDKIQLLYDQFTQTIEFISPNHQPNATLRTTPQPAPKTIQRPRHTLSSFTTPTNNQQTTSIATHNKNRKRKKTNPISESNKQPKIDEHFLEIGHKLHCIQT